jgi:hypothetical protein
MMQRFVLSQRRQDAFTYTEVLLSVALMAILLVPALGALQTGITGGSGSLANRQLALREKLETVLASPFGNVYAETYIAGANTSSSISTIYSDATGSSPDRRLVVLYRYDASTNALSADDTGLVFVSVYYESEGAARALNTLAGRWW